MGEPARPADDAGPDCRHARTAKKFLRDGRGLAKRRGVKLSPDKLRALEAKLAAKTISSDDLPATLKNEFPGEFAGMTLRAIEKLCP